mmetsp:Transcript_39486/g.126018  ORF Transcript_39486/g.126018 Transcript_39486/m.126018 type:complete len:174 (+) Transcript_39486:916-1437(+)
MHGSKHEEDVLSRTASTATYRTASNSTATYESDGGDLERAAAQAAGHAQHELQRGSSCSNGSDDEPGPGDVEARALARRRSMERSCNHLALVTDHVPAQSASHQALEAAGGASEGSRVQDRHLSAGGAAGAGAGAAGRHQRGATHTQGRGKSRFAKSVSVNYPSGTESDGPAH